VYIVNINVKEQTIAEGV